MKTLGIIIAAIFTLGTTYARPFDKVKTDTKTTTNTSLTLDTSTEYQNVRVATHVPSGLKNAITNELFYPTKAKTAHIEGQVYMRVTINEESNIEIVGLNATNPTLGNYVKEQLKSTYVKKPGCTPGQVYLMKVNFDIIN